MIITKAVGVGKHTDTTKRVIYHTEHQESKDYVATTADVHNPAKYAYVHEGRPDLGPRARAMQRMLAEEASYVDWRRSRCPPKRVCLHVATRRALTHMSHDVAGRAVPRCQSSQNPRSGTQPLVRRLCVIRTRRTRPRRAGG